MKINILKQLVLVIICTCTLAVTSCDDGLIYEKKYTTTTTGYTALITGTFKGQTSWPSKYSVVVAGFNDNSDYSIIQKTLAAKKNDSTEISMLLSNISDTTKTIEIAVVNSLRQRIATLFSYNISNDQNIDDTIRINVGELNVGMFQTINQNVFQGMNCSRCHASSTAAGHLDLTAANAYSSIVNVDAYKNNTYKRILPGNADSSFLYKVITTGDENVGYSHPALFTDSKYATFQTIIKNWIENGATE
ncbi:MAG: hypothetical protein K6E54_08835 [Bacteroidaceae bacterium]|nr:hypothetical protein [Bacteroidaceae bacterium]